MITVIEGIEGSGKTTFAKSLSRKFIPSRGAPENAQDVAERVEKELALLESDEDIVLDRSDIIGCYVYDGINMPSVYTRERVLEMLEVLRNKATIIFCAYPVSKSAYEKRMRAKHTKKYADLMVSHYNTIAERYSELGKTLGVVYYGR